MADIEVRHEPERMRFVVDMEGDDALIDYTRPAQGVIDLRHTFTPPAARGKGIAGAMVKAALEYAREAGLRVIPTCPYIAAYIEKHPEHADLVA